MKLIVLCAGQGQRLRPLTNEMPKCLVRYRSRALLDYILSCARACGLEDIVLVKGYQHEKLSVPGVKSYINERYATTNMVSSLFCAEEALVGDVLISYSDIVYSPGVLQKMLGCCNDFAVAVDRDWLNLWSKRMADPLSDAESMRIDAKGRISELGRKAGSLDEIQGQYMGLIKISADVIQKVREFYHSLDRSTLYEGQNFDNMYMTSFIQLIIDRVMPVQAVMTEGDWFEIDKLSDLELDYSTVVKQIPVYEGMLSQ